MLLGVDRLDCIKGILHKLYAFEKFFESFPEWIGRVVLVQIAVPSRTDVVEYQRLRDKAHQVVSRINGRFGNLLVVPVHYLDTSLSFEHMVSLYRIADVLVVSSVRDGMNLVAYEFVACQKEKHGVLILLEFRGEWSLPSPRSNGPDEWVSAPSPASMICVSALRFRFCAGGVQLSAAR